MYYKLTDATGKTHGNTQWGPCVKHTAHGDGTNFCSPDLIHIYNDPLVAILHNPMHGNFQDPQLWEAEAEEPVYNDRGLKLGAKAVTTLRRIPTPAISTMAKVRYAILCAKCSPVSPAWEKWATSWLSGEALALGYAASAASYAAYAASVAGANAGAGNPLDFPSLARQAVEQEAIVVAPQAR